MFVHFDAIDFYCKLMDIWIFETLEVSKAVD